MRQGLRAAETVPRPCSSAHVPAQVEQGSPARQPALLSPWLWMIGGPGAPLLIVLDLKEGRIQEPAHRPLLTPSVPIQPISTEISYQAKCSMQGTDLAVPQPV